MHEDNLDFDEEDSLKVFLIAFIERDKKKQLQQMKWDGFWKFYLPLKIMPDLLFCITEG